MDPNNLSCHALAVFTHCLKLMSGSDISQKISTEILNVLLLEVMYFVSSMNTVGLPVVYINIDLCPDFYRWINCQLGDLLIHLSS